MRVLSAREYVPSRKPMMAFEDIMPVVAHPGECREDGDADGEAGDDASGDDSAVQGVLGCVHDEVNHSEDEPSRSGKSAARVDAAEML